MTTKQPAPCTGLKVLDFTQVIGGPLATMVLADLGADVLKIEPPQGDAARVLPALADPQLRPFFETYNRGKRSCVLDLRTDEGKLQARRLAAEADVIVEAFRPGAMERLGLGYEELSVDRPELIYGSLTGFGRTGTAATRGGFDVLAQAESGLMSITGEPDGQPMKVGVHVVDIASGHILAQGILAALVQRERFGTGDRVDVSLFDVGCQLQAHYLTEKLITGRAPGRSGNFPATTAPSGMYDTADGVLIVASYQQPHWLRLVTVLGVPELAEREEYLTVDARVANRQSLVAELRPVFRTRSTAEWVRELTENGLVVGQVRDYDEVLASSEFIDAGLVLELEELEDADGAATGRHARTLRHPARHSASTGRATTRAPRLGEASAEVVASWGSWESTTEPTH